MNVACTRLAVIIEFTRRTDGGALLKCIRADGSTTWQRQDDDQAAFFPLRFDELAAKWRGVALGETLELVFPPL